MAGEYFKTAPMRILGSLILFMALIALASYAKLNFAKIEFINPSPATISVIGEGEVLAVPDIGQFSFSVTAEGDDASKAQETSGTKINDILAYLKEQGIEDKDVKTQNYNLYPKWRYEERLCLANSYCPPGERVQDGFQVSQTVSVKVRDTKIAGVIIAGVGEKGATNISNLNFTIDDIDALRAEARGAAIKDAEEKADLLAGQLGVLVVRLINYNEGGGYEPYLETRAMSFDSAKADDFSGPELPVGEQSTKVQVTITYEVN
ncbi:MAG: hypothetical protein ACI9BF_000865 [Candidatus Paceibacteria bacterium]|jgi:uncharacterized protein YggE